MHGERRSRRKGEAEIRRGGGPHAASGDWTKVGTAGRVGGASHEESVPPRHLRHPFHGAHAAPIRPPVIYSAACLFVALLF